MVGRAFGSGNVARVREVRIQDEAERAEQPLRRRSPQAAARPARGRSLRRIVGLVLLLPALALGFLLAMALVYSAVTPPSTLMLGRWAVLKPVDRQSVALAAISPHLVQAVIASEDQRFCLHAGVDWGALRDVVDDEEGPSRGASTISMQTVKNVFLWPGRSVLRKGLEIPLALATDALWGKRRMLEVYLNVAEWGEGVFGAEAAAQRWFGKPARNLTRGEAALLAAVLPNPILRNPALPSRGVRAQAARIQARMNGVGGLMGCLKR
ncbi:MAG: monofunctional biosynthetic peptidoglycan transglycosylase [Methylobacterium sp.]|uniref:monofunctional biosynthetic peptidoglycan transglycosylase n=1 Tax=Methylobacterium sp. TaxID=409 RepID=UPI0027207501|nr:monofunctional biosynthetic peptidoglycan transglycosylase [Methylobacterium sp.]MDO9429323.1 monofunctional biosynthetic peptidoglycan transglycosylase [Methylobacterium sp.]